MNLIWLRGLLARRAGRIVAVSFGIAVAVGLLGSLGAFLSASKASMTKRSTAKVAVDWQVELPSASVLDTALPVIRSEPSVATALPVGYGRTTGLSTTAGSASFTTGPGRVLGLPPAYSATFMGEIRYLTGSHDGVLIAQQTASNLHAGPGARVTIGRRGLPPVTVRVDGVVDLPQADSLFQIVGAPAGSQPQAPPDNVMLLPDALWRQVFEPLATLHPELATYQVHVLTNRKLPKDPSAAYTSVVQAAHHLEARLAGSGTVGDNLGVTLAAARADALYAQILFLFLATPGAVLAAFLTAVISGAGATRRRAEQALLRSRGAKRSTLLRLVAMEAALTGALGASLGLGVAAITGRLAFGTARFGATTTSAIGWAAFAVTAGLLIAVAAILLPAARDLKETTVAAARRPVGRPRDAWWLRYRLDFLLLIGALAVYWATSRNGYRLVIAPEGVSAISVNYWAFAGPAMLWVGSGLLVSRITRLVLRTKLAEAGIRPLAGRLSGLVAATMKRQRSVLARTVALIALAAAFVASSSIFAETYKTQARADAFLTNGADVTVTEPAAATVTAAEKGVLAKVPGVRTVEPLMHRFAYVGADLQDLYGVNPQTLPKTTPLLDAYFVGASAKTTFQRLASEPDAIIVSSETVKDFQLQRGDLIRLRLTDKLTGRLVTVPFHYVGVAKEFPTAPHDSFFLTNADYIAKVTHNDATGAFLITTDGTAPHVVADRIRAVVGSGPTVSDVQTSRQIIGSSLTAVDMSGLAKVELGYGLLLAVAATGLLLGVGFNERRRVYALARALGASTSQVGSFIWAEIAVTSVLGAIGGVALGWGLSGMLVKVLTGVFDPPPAALSVPWGYLAAAAGLAAAGIVASGVLASRRAQRPPISVLREL